MIDSEWETINNEFNSIDWDTLFDGKNPNQIVDIIISTIEKVISSNVAHRSRNEKNL